jgi:hypothetical protein
VFVNSLSSKYYWCTTCEVIWNTFTLCTYKDYKSWVCWLTPVIPVTLEVETVPGAQFQASPGNKLVRFHLNKQARYVGATCDPSNMVDTDRRIVAQGQSQTKPQDPIWKITKVGGSRIADQVVEHQPSKCKALSSDPKTAKKLKNISEFSFVLFWFFFLFFFLAKSHNDKWE